MFVATMFVALGHPKLHADMPDERLKEANTHLPARHALLPSASDGIPQNGNTTFEAKGNRKWADPAVIAYVPFGKTGSSTMRQMVSAAGPFCDGLVKGYSPAPLITSSPPNHCGNAPSRTTVQTAYGYCEALQASRPQSCNYLTMLRDPVEKMVSSWNYFCRSCQEGGRGCFNVPAQFWGAHTQKPAWLASAIKNNNDLPKDKDGIPVGQLQQVCPYFGLIEYARNNGNEYTRQFGTMPGCDAPGCLSHEKGPGKYQRPRPNMTAASDLDMPEEVIQEAIRAIERPDMLVMPLERLQTPAGLQALGEKLHYDFGRFANLHDNSGGSHEKATAKELKTLHVLLAPDIALYKKALARFEKEHPA